MKIAGWKLFFDFVMILPDTQKNACPERAGIFYGEGQKNLSFTIIPPGDAQIFARQDLRLHAAKIGAENAKNKNICRSLYLDLSRWQAAELGLVANFKSLYHFIQYFSL